MEKFPFIGQMDRKIKIVEPVTSQNATGEETVNYITLFEPWASMTDTSGGEDVEGKIRHITNRFYVIRYNALFMAKKTALMLEDDGVQYSIFHFLEMGRKRFIKILVKEYE